MKNNNTINTEEEISFLKNHFFANIEDIRFGIWLGVNGWEFYDSYDRLINLAANRTVCSIVELFSEYKKENQEP